MDEGIRSHIYHSARNLNTPQSVLHYEAEYHLSADIHKSSPTINKIFYIGH